MNTAIVIVLVLAVGRLIFIYYHPFGPCRACKGRGTNRGSTKKRLGRCARCGGTRLTQRMGSRALHKVIRGTSNAVRDSKKKRRL
jgi:DnaJ-class molecular chaperone